MAVTASLTLAQGTQDIANNRTQVTATLKCTSTNGSFNNNQQPGYIILNGTQYNFTNDFAANVTTTLYTVAAWVPHNSDGTKTVYANASYNTGVSSGTITASASRVLTTINRNSALGTVANFTIDGNPNVGNAFSVPVTKYVSGYYDVLNIKIGTSVVATRLNYLTGNVTFTSDELDDIYALMPKADVSFTFELKTYTNSGMGTLVGTSTKTATGTLSSLGLNPTFVDYVYDESNATVDALTGGTKFIKNNSGLSINISTTNLAAPNKGATIVEYTATCGTVSQTVSATSNNNLSLENINSNQVTVSVKDSRNNVTSVIKTIDLIEYTIPQISAILERKNGVETTALLKLTGAYMDVNFGVSNNTITACEVRYKPRTDVDFSAWTNILGYIDLSAAGQVVNDIDNEIVGITFNLVEYDIEIRVKDRLQYASYSSILSDGKVSRDTYKDDTGEYHWGINTMADENNTLNVGGSALVNGEINAVNDIKLNGVSLFAEKPKILVYINSAGLTNLTSGAYTIVPLTNIEYQTGNNYNSTTYEYTVPEDGYYLVSHSVEFSTPVSGCRLVSRLSEMVGSTSIDYAIIHSATTTSCIAKSTKVHYLTSGMKLKHFCKVDNNSTVDVGGDNPQTCLNIVKL